MAGVSGLPRAGGGRRRRSSPRSRRTTRRRHVKSAGRRGHTTTSATSASWAQAAGEPTGTATTTRAGPAVADRPHGGAHRGAGRQAVVDDDDQPPGEVRRRPIAAQAPLLVGELPAGDGGPPLERLGGHPEVGDHVVVEHHQPARRPPRRWPARGGRGAPILRTASTSRAPPIAAPRGRRPARRRAAGRARAARATADARTAPARPRPAPRRRRPDRGTVSSAACCQWKHDAANVANDNIAT